MCSMGKKIDMRGRHGNHHQKHGHSGHNWKSKTYDVWSSMVQRTTNVKDKSFCNYGGRGVGISASWLFFENFLADMGVKPDGMTLERIDNGKGYSKENCKWATYSEQLRNTRRNVWYTGRGKVMCERDWARELGISNSAIHTRKSRGKALVYGDIELLEVTKNV